MRVNELIDSAIEDHRRRSAQESATVVQSVADPLSAARELAARARRSIALAVSDAADATTLWPPVAGGTVAVRLLCRPCTLAGDQLRHVLRQRPDLQLRLSRSLVRGVLLVDGEVALVRCAPGPADPASVIRSPVLLLALEALFAAAWAHAAPIAGRSRPHQGAHADLGRGVLTQLCAGDTDRQAARRLGVSLRTYRRRVASIMQELGAESRFQAGALAVEAGLLPASA
ncbi:MAG: response regulator transcription factor [Mycobacteriales bacterium]